MQKKPSADLLKEIEQLKALLAEAMDLLGDLQPRMALFNNQRYWQIKDTADKLLDIKSPHI